MKKSIFNVNTASKSACLQEIEILEKYIQDRLNDGYIDISNFDLIKSNFEKLENELNKLEEQRSKIPRVLKKYDKFIDRLLLEKKYIPQDELEYNRLTFMINEINDELNKYELKHDFRVQNHIRFLINQNKNSIDRINGRIKEIERDKFLKFKKINDLKARLINNEDQNRKIARFIKKNLTTDGTCVYCDVRFSDTKDIHVDHIIPINYNGMAIEENLVLACSSCNVKKSNLLLREFIKKYNLNRDEIEKKLDKLGKRY